MIDVMDGMRAKRLKCGSPLGRLIDEGLDLLAYVSIGILVGYAFKVSPYIMVISFGFQNGAFYTMELKHKIKGALVMKLGELGGVEVELLYAFFVGLAGVIGIEKY
eukprot:CAMPEP_0170558292 /NCGR_PEP_ID=MMETSP0211-20121228/34254_1 /TAXON_ID=311385 /ORGANISM="Pseudokeronopsis sp., Strain OXSARD2" /LENGTH=105 /DNA_ID=CAMNT_0010870103 /DNA_START=192 /DNA_END=509 /DNA_ORIENTATION=+